MSDPNDKNPEVNRRLNDEPETFDEMLIVELDNRVEFGAC